jgi:hypothetical protein
LIQELVLVLDGRDGVGLVFNPFGASVFWVPAGHPKRVPKPPLRRPVEAADEGLSALGSREFFWEFPEFFGAPETGRNRPKVKRWGVELHDLGGPVRVALGVPENRPGFTG